MKSAWHVGIGIVVTLIAFALAPAQGDTWTIVVHGGAGSSPSNFTRPENEQRRRGMETALRIGAELLAESGTALEAVEAVIRNLEDNPVFNAGKGAVYNAEGQHELDASIMDGSDLSCGAVAGVRIVKHPITLARRVMTETEHVLLAGPGADLFAREVQVELVSNDYFDTAAKRAEWQRRQQRAAENQPPADPPGEDHKGTVGCVVLDMHGNLAAGTSTGGLKWKKFGRVGDSPLIAAGTYADNSSCAVSCTGVGEHFIRHAVAYDLAARMKYGQQALVPAAQAIMQETLQPGWGGLIAVDRHGNVAMEFNTPGMARGWADSTGTKQVLWDVSLSQSPAFTSPQAQNVAP